MMKLVLVCAVLAAAAAFDLSAVSNYPCSQITDRDMCVVAAEQSQTCGWCSVKDRQFCLPRHAVDFVTRKNPAVSCTFADEEVVTRAPVMENGVSGKKAAADDWIPVVFMHGIGDSGGNPGMQSIAKSVTEAYPGLYSVSVRVADGINGYTTDILTQVQQFADAVRSDSNLSRGFTAAGLSQGGLIVRAYVELFNDPPVHSVISLCGPQEGVGECPGGTPSFICNLVRTHLYNAPISFAGYWKNVLDKQSYLDNNKHLVYWNNEKTVNSTFHDNMVSLEKLVLIEALNDTTVEPHVSEDFGFYSWGSEDKLLAFNETDEYASDAIGLKTLDEAGKLFHHGYVGNHLRWSREFWQDTVIPYFNATFSSWQK